MQTDCDLHELLKIAAKKSLSRGLVIHNTETGAFRAVVGKKGMKSKYDKRTEKERERREKKERRRERKEKKLRKLQKSVTSSTEESPKVGLTLLILNSLSNNRDRSENWMKLHF